MHPSIKLILFYSLVFSQKQYPHFIEASKQLEFEKKQIHIEPSNKNEKVVLNDDKNFNWLSIFFPSEPKYFNTSVQTSFNKNCTITINGKTVDEIQMLSQIGLTEESIEVMNNYQQQTQNQMENISIDTTYTQFYFINKGLTGCMTFICSITFLSATNLIAAGNYRQLIPFFIYGGGSRYFYKKYKNMSADRYYSVNTNGKTISINQVMSYPQLKEISEKYNQKLYNDILKN